MGDSEDFETTVTEGWRNVDEAIDIEKYGLTEDNVGDRYFAVFYANPEFYYVCSGFYYSYYDDGTICEILPCYAETDKDVINTTLENIEKASDEILFTINGNMTDFDKIMTVHDYMVLNYEYDYDVASVPPEEQAAVDYYHPSYSLETMVEKKGVCQGYAFSFMYMMEKLGIECVFVSSDAMNHAWNLVMLDGKWYHIDVTWDDTDTLTQVGHTFELLSSERIRSLSDAHYGFDLGELVADSTLYDDKEWHDSNTEFAYCHGTEYWIEDNCIVDEFGNVIYENLDGGDGKWSLEGGYTLPGAVFAGLAEYNGKIYFNTDEGIYTYNPHSNKVRKISSEQCVSGLYVNKDTLVYSKGGVRRGDDGILYLNIVEGGTVVLEKYRFAEPYADNGKILAKIYNATDDAIFVFSRTDDKCEVSKVSGKGYFTVKFDAADNQAVYYWDSLLRPLRDKEEVIVK